MRLENHQRQILALCLIDKLNWYLVAREARRGNLERLLSGEIVERGRVKSTVLEESGQALCAGVKMLDALLEEAELRATDGFRVGARLTTVLDDDYPINLLRIFNLPPFLFYRGELEDDTDIVSVAVVGTRQASADGLKRARKLSGLLARKGVTVVSGLARGIDTAAHEATLEAGGRTVAVIGTGICRTYPAENEGLSATIARTGAVVSQFWPQTRPTTYGFPRRNITMSGFVQGTVVVEASATSGAKMQARYAVEHGKKVFVLRSLVERYSWARRYLERHPTRVIEVDNEQQIVDQLVDPEHVRRSVIERQQLRLELG